MLPRLHQQRKMSGLQRRDHLRSHKPRLSLLQNSFTAWLRHFSSPEGQVYLPHQTQSPNPLESHTLAHSPLLYHREDGPQEYSQLTELQQDRPLDYMLSSVLRQKSFQDQQRHLLFIQPQDHLRDLRPGVIMPQQ